MGNKNKSQPQEVKPTTKTDTFALTRSSFEFIQIIGRGGFGKVWKVSCRKYGNKIYAMKEMSKTKIIDKRSENSIKAERDFLSRIDHPFIINMHFAFQDNDNLYLVMDYLTGGDLRYHISQLKRFNEEQTKFFIACMLLGLEYCHSNNIIHRDIKPENLVLDSNGYLKITDFGIAKYQQPNNSKETSGTPGYMSPEVLNGLNHTIAVDFFAIGVIGYEFMNGVRPYLGRSRKEIKEKVMAHQACIKANNIKEGWSLEAADCINKMLQRKQNKRLGYHGVTEVKEHQWFKDFPWKDLYTMKLTAPFIPKMNDNFDSTYCKAQEKIGIKTKERYNQIMSSSAYKNAFSSYYDFNRFNQQCLEQYNKEKFTNPHTVYLIKEDDSKAKVNHRNRSSKSYNGLPLYKMSAIDPTNSAYYAANSFVMKRCIQKRVSFDGSSTVYSQSGGTSNTTNTNTGNKI